MYRYCGTYSYTEVLVSTTELILILRSIYWFYRTWTCISNLIHVLQSIYLSYGTYTDLTEHILVLQNLDMYFRSYTCLTEDILILRNLYRSYGAYTGLTELGHVFQILYMSYRAYTYLTDLILVLRNLYLSYGSYSCAKVPVGTMSRNRSGSYHIQGQIRLIQIRTLVFRRYRSQIHYTEVTIVTTRLILIRTSRRSYRVLLIQNI